MSEAKSETLVVRLTPATKKAYYEKATEKAREFEGTPSDILRELVIAFTEDRLTVAPRSTL